MDRWNTLPFGITVVVMTGAGRGRRPALAVALAAATLPAADQEVPFVADRAAPQAGIVEGGDRDVGPVSQYGPAGLGGREASACRPVALNEHEGSPWQQQAEPNGQ
jgi:hypothetical protein